LLGCTKTIKEMVMGNK